MVKTTEKLNVSEYWDGAVSQVPAPPHLGTGTPFPCCKGVCSLCVGEAQSLSTWLGAYNFKSSARVPKNWKKTVICMHVS